MPEGWRIGTPDAVFTLPRPIHVPAEGTIPYEYVKVPTNLTEDKWVQAMKVRPGAREVVHHILVFVEFPDSRKREEKPIDGGLFRGYFGIMVPGEQPTVFPEGLATLVFQIHYTASGKPAKDQSSIGLVFAKGPPKYEVQTRGIVNLRLRIPPHAENHREVANFRFARDSQILSFLPHMHVRGKSFRYVAIYPDGKEEILLDVPKYDFRWQTQYRLKEPKLVPKGTRIRAIAHFDNSKNNPENPNKEARFGK